MQRLLTAIQASGDLHIGNYLGALKPFTDSYRNYESFLMVADYHALTTLKDPAIMRQNTINVVKDYLAAGVDPDQATIFQQSQVPEHAELAWIFECLVTVPFLELSHAYKDKVAKGLEANAGLFNYPMLMAADILLYDTDVVPVGADQRQHIEYTREAAAKFNNQFGHTFKEPKGIIDELVATVPGTDGKKMSKSYKNTIPLFGSKDDIAKAVMSIVTDSSASRPENVYAIHMSFKDPTELDVLYTEKRGNYKALKEALIEDLNDLVAPMRERRFSIYDDEVRDVLRDGTEKASLIARRKMLDIKNKIGVIL